MIRPALFLASSIHNDAPGIRRASSWMNIDDCRCEPALNVDHEFLPSCVPITVSCGAGRRPTSSPIYIRVRPERLFGAARLTPAGSPFGRSPSPLRGAVVELPASWFVVAQMIL